MQKLMTHFLLSISRNRAGIEVKVCCVIMRYDNLLSVFYGRMKQRLSISFLGNLLIKV